MKYVQWNLQKQKLCAWQNRIHSKRYFQCYSYGNTKCVHWSFKRNKPTTIEHIGNSLACRQFIHEKLQAFAKNKNAMACNLCNKRFVQSIIIKFIHGNNYWRTILDAIFRNKIQMIIIEIKMTFSASITYSNRMAINVLIQTAINVRFIRPNQHWLVQLQWIAHLILKVQFVPAIHNEDPMNAKKDDDEHTHTHSYKNCSLICFGCAYLFECISMRTLYALCNKNVLNLKLIITF